MGSFRKVTEFLKASRREGFDSVKTDKKEYAFGKSGGFVVNDPGEARELQARYGHNELIAMPVDDHPMDRADPGHTYTFRAKAMPWATYCELCGLRTEDGKSFCHFHERVIAKPDEETEDASQD